MIELDLPLFLAAAGDITAVTEKFGLKPSMLLAQLVSFGLVAVTIYYLGIRPILAQMGEREKEIRSGLEYTKEMKAKLDQTQVQTAELLKKASLDAQAIVNEARTTATEFEARRRREAEEQATQLVAKAREAMERERVRLLDETRAEVTRLVVATTERVLRQELTEADRARFNAAAARELANV